MELVAAHCVPSTRSRGRSQHQALALAAISAGFLMITLDATIVNVALRAIGSDLGGARGTHAADAAIRQAIAFLSEALAAR